MTATSWGSGNDRQTTHASAHHRSVRNRWREIDAGKEMGIPVEYVDREDLAKVTAPNPSDTVKAFEGTASVSEAAAILVSNGKLVVEKQKFPPNLTIAIARIEN